MFHKIFLCDNIPLSLPLGTVDLLHTSGIQGSTAGVKRVKGFCRSRGTDDDDTTIWDSESEVELPYDEDKKDEDRKEEDEDDGADVAYRTTSKTSLSINTYDVLPSK